MHHALMISLIFLGGLVTGAVPFALMYYIKSKRMTQDTLTRLPDYKNFYEKLAKRIRRLNNREVPFGFALIDIDDFHRYNREGYESGDETLRKFASRFSSAFAEIAFCARFRMGDEFVLLFDVGKENEIREKLDALNNDIPFTYSLEIFSARLISENEAVKRLQLQLFEKKSKKN